MKTMKICVSGHVFPIILIHLFLKNYHFVAGINKKININILKTKIEIKVISRCTLSSLYPDFSENLAHDS